jgi:hypothetical protein
MSNYQAQKAFDILNNKHRIDEDHDVSCRFDDYLIDELNDLIMKLERESYQEENSKKLISQ